MAGSGNNMQKGFRQWSILWIIQRVIAVIREGRLSEIRLSNVYGTFIHDHKMRRSLKRNFPERYKVAGIYKGIEARSVTEEIDILPCPGLPPSPVNEFFDRVYFINLERRLDRRLAMIQKLRALNISARVINACDGDSKEIRHEFKAYYDRPLGMPDTHPLELKYKRKMIMSPGAWAYLKTYIRLLKEASGKGYKKILCLDDDIFFIHDFNERFKELTGSVPEDWDLLYLGASQHNWGPLDSEIASLEKPRPCYYPQDTHGSFALGISSRIMSRLVLQAERFNCSFDSGPLQSITSEAPANSFVAYPNLVIAEVGQSDIGPAREMAATARDFRWDMEKYHYPFQSELVSVIMPAYNAERTIEKSILSIQKQSYSNMELIVADDGSTDRTAAIVKDLARRDPRIILLTTEKNQGCYYARNRALRVSKGRYIAIQDSDDISLSDRIMKQLIPLCSGNAMFTIGRVMRSNCSPEELDPYDQPAMLELVEQRRAKDGSYMDRPILGLMTSMFSRELFERLGLFWENSFGADAEFCERILFSLSGKSFRDDGPNVHLFLSRYNEVPRLYKQIEDVILVSPKMSGTNITHSYTDSDRKAFEAMWRKRLRGEISYDYPAF
jgi:glycosyltransferase involved in cell wall biosynthesis